MATQTLGSNHVTMARRIKFWLLLLLVCCRIASDSVVPGERRTVPKDHYAAFSTLITSVRCQCSVTWRLTVSSNWSKRPMSVLVCSLLLCGDIHLNPGPVKYPCQVCGKAVKSNQDGIECSKYEKWNHRTCDNMSDDP